MTGSWTGLWTEEGKKGKIERGKKVDSDRGKKGGREEEIMIWRDG